MVGFRRPGQALGSLIVATVAVLFATAPALAAPPPYPAGAQATALVGGTPLVQATCPANSPGVVASGNSTKGGISVGYPAGARCTAQSASTDGFYSIAGVTPPLPGSLRFSSGCQNSTGQNGNAVDVPAGSTVNGVLVQTQTTVTALNAVIVFPGGQTAIANEVSTDPTSLTRNALRFTSGPNTGTIVGQVICGVKYPLAVNDPSAGTANDLGALRPAGGSDGNTTAWIVGAIGLLLMSQLALGGFLWRRRRNASA